MLRLSIQAEGYRIAYPYWIEQVNSGEPPNELVRQQLRSVQKPQAPKAVHTRNHRELMEKRWENEGPLGPDGQLHSSVLFLFVAGWSMGHDVMSELRSCQDHLA
ncbi:uncharacterized protein B0T23DRAFT_404467 [Neurospora hispaniola]|uniref:Uncharacterized protein n=1 Tax=Neurospora hispaniola TaxID=588809 RepID=A0AAJ0I7H2_9PEZI|nr:hypothetical protein B0T23DRAFT_404467 [Neurospora hispaniola]